MVERRLIRRYRPFGASFVVDTDDPRVHDAIGLALARYPVTAGLPADLRVELVTRTLTVDGRVPPAWPRTALTESANGISLRSGATHLDVRHGGDATVATLAIEPELLDDPHAVRVFAEAPFWSAAIGRGALHAVHAGLVGAHGVNLLLRGSSGAGKSTLTYACLRRRMRVVSDDWVYAVAGTRDLALHGSPWLVWLTVEASARFPELAAAAPVPHPGSDRIKVPVRPPVWARRITARPDVVVFVEPSPSVTMREIDGAEAIQRFGASALDSERGSLPEPFVADLLARRTVVLGRGGSPDEAAAALHDLARDHAGRRPRTSPA